MPSKTVFPLLAAVLGAGLTYALSLGLLTAWMMVPWFLAPLFLGFLRQPTRLRAGLLFTLFGISIGALILRGAEHYGLWLYALGVIGSAFPFTVYGLLGYGLVQRHPAPELIPLSLATLYALIEMIAARSTFLVSFRMAGLVAFEPFWLQSAAVAGSGAVAFVVVYVNASLAVVARQRLNRQPLTRNIYLGPVGGSIALVGILAVYGGLSRPAVERASGQPTSFAGIQGGISAATYQAAQQNPRLRQEIQDTYLALTTEAVEKGYHRILWPEEALDVPFQRVQPALRRFLALHDCQLIAGFGWIEDTRRFNTVLNLNATAAVSEHYRKTLLIPFAERRQTAGSERHTIRLDGRPLATPICFEALFPHYLRAWVKDGAEAIFVFTDESGLRNPNTSTLLLNQAILRAVENRRWVVRIAQNGISAVVDPTGVVRARLDYNTTGVLPAALEWRRDLSWYTRYGDGLDLLVLLLAIVLGWPRPAPRQGVAG